MRRRAVIAAGLAALAGCGQPISRGGENETPPEVVGIEFRNRHDRPHEVGVEFTADGEVLFEHTASLPADDGGAIPSETVRPEIPKRNWLLHGFLDGEERGLAIPQGRIEYTRAAVLCRVNTEGVLDLRVSAP